MANDIYRIYLAENMALAKTMVIKSEVSAIANNKYLSEIPGVSTSSDKSTWRYYMNISGSYHSTDVMMKVRSLDTQELIDFTKENLVEHRATAREYVYGTRYYKQLLEQYPNQEILILGILNPVDIRTAIAAKEGTILWMDSNLVESNEHNLKQLLQERITSFLERWHVEDYSRAEDLYDMVRLSILYTRLPSFILNARLENCRTIYAHSFHIRMFLASHGRLDVYMDTMTKYQQLFFYRNLPYLNRNPGQNNVFKWLIENVLEVRNFPIAKYTMVHNVEEMPDSLYPQVDVIRQEMTQAYARVPTETYSVEEILYKESPLAKSNAQFIAERSETIDKQMKLSAVNQVETKVLDSKVVDRTDSQIYTVAGTLLNHWLYLAATDRYRAIVRVINPRTGEEMNISALDAFLLFLYCYNKVIDQPLPAIPKVQANRVRRIPQPPISELLTKVNVNVLGKELAQRLYDMATPVSSYISTASFNEAIVAVYHSSLDQFYLSSAQGNFHVRGYAEAIVEGMYTSIGLEVGAGQDYSVWLKERGLEQVEEFGIFECEELATNLLQVATGADLNVTVSLSDIHRDMIGIMTQLSSYSIQFVREMNANPVRPMAYRFIRPGHSYGKVFGASKLDILKLKLVKSRAKVKNTTKGDSPLVLKPNSQGGIRRNSQSFMLGLKTTSGAFTRHRSRVELPIMGARTRDPEPLKDLTALMLVDYSDAIVSPLDPQDIELTSILLQQTLNGLNPPDIIEAPLHLTLDEVLLDGLNSPWPGGRPLTDVILQTDLFGFDPVR